MTLLLAAVFLAPPAAPPGPIPGSLVLAGDGKLPDAVRKQFFDLAGGAKARLVVIPTAGAGADGPEAGAALDPWRELKPGSAVVLHTRDRKTADDPAFVAPLREATGVWLDGGDRARLTAAYKGTAVERELAAVLKRGGVVGGTSAGMAVRSEVMIAGGGPEARVGPGFGWLPGFVVDEHFVARDRLGRLAGVLAGRPGLVGLGVDEATAAVVRGRRIRVLGESTVTVVLPASANRPQKVEVLKPGSEADLLALRRAALARAADRFPAEKPADPVVPKGTLIIVGGGGMPPGMWQR